METFATILAGLVLAGAATAGVVVTQGAGPSGEPGAPLTEGDPAVVYDVGQ